MLVAVPKTLNLWTIQAKQLMLHYSPFRYIAAPPPIWCSLYNQAVQISALLERACKAAIGGKFHLHIDLKSFYKMNRWNRLICTRFMLRFNSALITIGSGLPPYYKCAVWPCNYGWVNPKPEHLLYSCFITPNQELCIKCNFCLK